MKNSKVLCHPLCLPFMCVGIDSRETTLPLEGCKHYFAELILLREGRLRVLLDQEEIFVSSGEAVFISPGVRHLVTLGEGSFARMDLVRMDPDQLPDWPDYMPCPKALFAQARRDRLPMLIPAPEAESLSELCAGCVRESAGHLYAYDLDVASRLNLICVFLLRFWLTRGLVPAVHEGQKDPICALSGYIRSHLRDSLRVEDLAAMCGLSYPWFAKKFREVYGVSCKDYIEQARVAQVERFLLFTDLDLARISEATGYADCSHMIKNFKRIMEITPGQYRLKQRQISEKQEERDSASKEEDRPGRQIAGLRPERRDLP